MSRTQAGGEGRWPWGGTNCGTCVTNTVRRCNSAPWHWMGSHESVMHPGSLWIRMSAGVGTRGGALGTTLDELACWLRPSMLVAMTWPV